MLSLVADSATVHILVFITVTIRCLQVYPHCDDVMMLFCGV